MNHLAFVSLTAALLTASSAARAIAQDAAVDQPAVSASATPISDSLAAEAARLAADPQDPQGARPVAIEYSDAHETRAKIHRYLSWAVLPVMATEFALGQQLYNDPNSINSSSRGVHGAVGAGLIGLFAVQSVTGVWNLVEENSAPGQKKRLVHGFMMLAAEGGFIAAAAMAPGHSRNDLINFDANKSTHRNVAVVSIGVGTAGYLLMLLTKNH
jgi:hypothetical protein